MGLTGPITKGLFTLAKKAADRYRRSASLRTAVRKTAKEGASWLPDAIPHAIKAIGRRIDITHLIGSASKKTKRRLMGAEIGGSIAATGGAIGYEGHLLHKEKKERTKALKHFKSSLRNTVARQEKTLSASAKKIEAARKFKPVRRIKHG